MKALIKNILGIKTAEIHTQQITIIGGPNAQGKTSILRALAAGLTGKIIPVEDVAKKDALMLVHNGETAGEVHIDTGTGESRIVYPLAERSTTGEPVEISSYSAGLDSILEYNQTERAKILSDMLQISPSRDDLVKSLPDVPASLIDQIWPTIDVHGWDTAHESQKKEGAKLKGAWEQITGGKYGTGKAASWLPKNWSYELASKSLDKLNEEVKLLEEFYTVAVSNSAVSEAEIDRLKKLSAGIELLKSQVTNQKTELDGLQKNRTDIENGLRKLTNPASVKSVKCPHCSQSVQIVGDRLEKALSADEVTKISQVWAETNESLKSVNAEIDRAKRSLNESETAVSNAEIASAQLKKLQARTAGESAESVETCKQKLETAKAKRDAVMAKKQADEKHAQITERVKIVKVLAPDGLRRSKMIEALTGFNNQLSQLCKTAGWDQVEIQPDMSIRMGGRPFGLLSGSEQFRVRVVLQIATALHTGDTICLIDAADILDSVGRVGLLKIIKTTGITGVIGITYHSNQLSKETDAGKREEMIKSLLPDVSKLGGVRYWVEGGESVVVQ